MHRPHRTRRRPTASTVATLLIAALMLTPALAGCGDDEQTASTGPSPGESPATATPSAVTTGTASSPAPGPTPVDAETMSEEELAAASGDAVEEATVVAESAADAADAAVADGTVSEDEADAVTVAVQDAEQLVEYAEDVLAAYAEQYGAYAVESLAELDEISASLATIADDLDGLLALAEQASAGVAAAAGQIETAAARARAAADAAAQQADTWRAQLGVARALWEAAALDTAPTDVASSRAGALQSAGAYLQSLGDTLRGGALSAQGLQSIYQASANAVASLEAQGGRLADLGAQIESLTGKLAAGQLPQVKAELPQVEALFP